MSSEGWQAQAEREAADRYERMLGHRPTAERVMPNPIKVVHVPGTVSQAELDQIRQAIEQIELDTHG